MGLFKKKEDKLEWEPIDDESDRLKVPGGWIVRSWIKIERTAIGIAAASIHQVFIEDPSHSWKLEDIK